MWFEGFGYLQIEEVGVVGNVEMTRLSVVEHVNDDEWMALRIKSKEHVHQIEIERQIGIKKDQ